MRGRYLLTESRLSLLPEAILCKCLCFVLFWWAYAKAASVVAYHRTQRNRNERAGRSSNLSLPLMQTLGNRPIGLHFAGGAAEWLEFVGIL